MLMYVHTYFLYFYVYLDGLANKQIRTKPPWMATGDRLVSLVMFVG